MSNSTCTLCGTPDAPELFRKKEVVYYSCGECGLVFMDAVHWPSKEVERERYLQHNNDPDDSGYVAHLMDLGSRVAKYVEEGAVGLDYGCGPAPVLAEELRKVGFNCSSYDPIFFKEGGLLKRKYKFVTCCEAFEHFHRPARELAKLVNMLEVGGVLGIKTSIIRAGIDYERWYYANDLTHVCFLSKKTVDWLAGRYCLELLEHDDGRIVFRRRMPDSLLSVAAGVIRRDGVILLAMRKDGSMAGKWEFPGGKLKSGETPAEALRREIIEEFGIAVECGEVIMSIQAPLDRGWIDLIFVEAAAQDDPLKLTDHVEYRWVSPSESACYDLAPADGAFVDLYLVGM